jgi:microsomal dipeptidase-like Zn-dependent dipeptidase
MHGPLFSSLLALVLGTSQLGCSVLNWVGIIPPDTPRLPAPPVSHEAEQCGAGPLPVAYGTPGEPIWGAADFHNHPAANVGFGGRVIWGEAFHEGGEAAALPTCGSTDLCLSGYREEFLCEEVACRLVPDPAACREVCNRNRCNDNKPHGHFGLADPVGLMRDGGPHRPGGYPDYAGWPNFKTHTHQQQYHAWLRRAFEGGLKLIVALTVSNEILCQAHGHDSACDDTSTSDRQIDEVLRMERYIDYMNDCAYNGNGWFRVARSPRLAREIIASGAMAVVLGLEVDAPFNCYKNGGCTEESVVAEIERYRARGVRHVFPVHLFDNAIGGAAVKEDVLNLGNFVLTGGLFNVYDCKPAGYGFQFGDVSKMPRAVLGAMAARFGVSYPAYPDVGAHCNSRGLTKFGDHVVRALMRSKMIIDVDHMSVRTRTAVLDRADACEYPGIVSGHSGFIELLKGDARKEGELTAAEVGRIVRRGGLIAPLLAQGDLDGFAGDPSDKRIANDCGNSAHTFAQAYRYAVRQVTSAAGAANKDITEERRKRSVAVGFGSDMNGMATLPAPRFGLFACGTRKEPKGAKPVVYAQSDPGLRKPGDLATPSQMSSGSKTFDINTHGFAHMGMFPDFVAELQTVGLSPGELKPLFSAAEAYIRMWELAESEPPKCQ